MKRISKFLLIIGTIVCCVKLNAQQTFKGEPLMLDPATSRFVHPASVNGWIQLRQDAPYVASLIFEEAPQLLGMHADDEMRIFKMNVDVVGNHHYKYAQYYKGIRVEGIEQVVHEKNSRVYLINGDFVSDLNPDVLPSITAEQAIQNALNIFPVTTEQVRNNEESIKRFKKESNATGPVPGLHPELLIVKKNASGEMKSENLVLAWRISMFAEKPLMAKYVYVDALTGTVIRSRNLIYGCSPATCNTTFNGEQQINTTYMTGVIDYTGDDHTGYFTKDNCNPNSEIISYWKDFDDYYMRFSIDNSWTSPGAEKMVNTSLWGLKKAYLYFEDQFNHESFDGNGGLMEVFNRNNFQADDDQDEGAWFAAGIDNIYVTTGYNINYGHTNNYNTLDIIGHEFTHGIIEYAHFDALDPEDESGALAESFADIFGEMVEHYATGSHDWEHAGENTDPLNPHRQFSVSTPDTYQGTGWSTSSEDNGGIHTNCSVQNHLFYLLANGGSGTNDLGWEYEVSAIGLDEAASIAWQAMMNYVDGSDGYIIDRNCWIQAAIDLYGSCSQEVISVGQAFSAAGVTHYTQFALGSICGTYSSIFPTTIDGAEEIRNASVFINNFLGDCTATINSGTTVTAQSGTLVNLHPGFTAKSGCTFTALVVPCEVSDYDPNNLKQTNEEYSSPESSTTNGDDFFYLYPNPSDENFTVEFALNTEAVASMYVMDVTGRKVMSITENELLEAGKPKLQVNTSSLLPAAYLLVMSSPGKTQTQKFIVQH